MKHTINEWSMATAKLGIIIGAMIAIITMLVYLFGGHRPSVAIPMFVFMPFFAWSFLRIEHELAKHQ